MTAKSRPTRTTRTAKGGCYACQITWSAANAQGSAALHHDKTGHMTWAMVEMSIVYGEAASTAPAPGPPPRAPAALARPVKPPAARAPVALRPRAPRRRPGR